MIDKLFEWLFALIVLLVLLPCIVSMIIRTLGPVLLAAVLIAVVIGAFRSYEWMRPRTGASRSGGASQRTPILPEGDH